MVGRHRTESVRLITARGTLATWPGLCDEADQWTDSRNRPGSCAMFSAPGPLLLQESCRAKDASSASPTTPSTGWIVRAIDEVGEDIQLAQDFKTFVQALQSEDAFGAD